MVGMLQYTLCACTADSADVVAPVSSATPVCQQRYIAESVGFTEGDVDGHHSIIQPNLSSRAGAVNSAEPARPASLHMCIESH